MALKKPGDINPLTYAFPKCPNCGSEMVERKRNRDGRPFWGCSMWAPSPGACKGTLPHSVGLQMMADAKASAEAKILQDKEALAAKTEDDFGFIHFLDID